MPVPRHAPLTAFCISVLLLGGCATAQVEQTDRPAASTDIRTGMPVLMRHEGRWEGTFRRYDADGNLIATFPSTITTEFPTEGEYDYVQVNRYTREGQDDIVIRSAGNFDGERLRFGNQRVRGYVVDDPSDENGRSTLLFFEYLDGSGTYVYETVQMSDDGQSRHRATQYFNADGTIKRRTLIDERKTG